eukprot:4757683-Pleurochrysis_carterae.AAC.1
MVRTFVDTRSPAAVNSAATLALHDLQVPRTRRQKRIEDGEGDGGETDRSGGGGSGGGGGG